MLPDFIIIGAHKAGTSSLYRYLQQHPSIFMPVLKEPRFFAFNEDNPTHREKSRQVFPIRTLPEYEALFEEGVSFDLVGEASPEYLNSSIAAKRIYECCSTVKLIVSLRNPSDRAYSLYQMSFRSGRTESSFPDWINGQMRKSDYSIRTLFYYENLARYFDLYKRDKIKVCLFDDIRANSAAVVKDLYGFLNVDQSFTPDTSKTYNQGGLPKNRLLHRLLSNRNLRNVVKPFIPSKAKDFANKLTAKNLEKASSIDADYKLELNSMFKDDINKLEELICRDLSSWKN